MASFVKVAKTTDLSDPGQILLEVEDRIVVLFHVGGAFFCIDDVCTHDGGPLSEGRLDDHTIACPRHGARFDIRTGKALTMPATVDTAAHEVQVRGDEVWVRINESGAPPGNQAASATKDSKTTTNQVTSTAESGSWGSAELKTVVESSPSAPASGLSEDLVREELKKVVDPELFVNIVDLGLIYNVDLIP